MPDESVTSLKFQLGGALREWVEKVSAENGHSLAEEIRQQLGTALRFDEDRQTKFLAEEIFLLANEVRKEVGDRWYESEYSRAIFVAAVTDHITNFGKADEPYRKDPSHIETEETMLGRTIARLFRRHHP